MINKPILKQIDDLRDQQYNNIKDKKEIKEIEEKL